MSSSTDPSLSLSEHFNLHSNSTSTSNEDYTNNKYPYPSELLSNEIFKVCQSEDLSLGEYIEKRKKLNNTISNEEWNNFMNLCKNNTHLPDCLYYLSYCYSEGLSVEKNEKLSFEYAKKSADSGYKFGQNLLGYYYKNGVGVEKDNNIVFKYYEMSAKQYSRSGLFNLARCYEEGIGCEINFERAMDYYKLSAENGYFDGWAAIGYMYSNGTGVEKNLEEAIKYYKLAAEKDNEDACYSLGYCYFNYEMDDDEKSNREEAFKWCKKSADLGHKKHLNILNYLLI